MIFTPEYLKPFVRNITTVKLSVGLTRDGFKHNVVRSNILNAITLDEYGAADRSIRFELYSFEAEDTEPCWLIYASLFRFDDIENESLEMDGTIYYSLDSALEAFCKKVNAMQIVVGSKYIIDTVN